MAPELAAFGYGAAVSPQAPADDQKAAWALAFDRLRERDALPADRQAFTFRPLELLGLCVAVKDLAASTSYAQWLLSLFPDLRRNLQEPWPKMLLEAARATLKPGEPITISVDPVGVALEELCLLLWMTENRAFGKNVSLAGIDHAHLRETVLTRCAAEEPDPLDAARAALVYYALQESVNFLLRSKIAENWQVGRPQKDSLELVAQICRRFPSLARQLTLRHNHRNTIEIRDEYDVQDVLRAVLWLFFEDVREEEWTPSYAGNSSRIDFLLWGERLVIETKMTRKGLDQKRVADELIIDKERYRAHHRCQTLVCFVYDPEHICATPAALENDLAQKENPRVRVIVSPR